MKQFNTPQSSHCSGCGFELNVTFIEGNGKMKIKNKQAYFAKMGEMRVTCAKCGRKDARLSPIGILCPTCTFKTETVPAETPTFEELEKIERPEKEYDRFNQ